MFFRFLKAGVLGGIIYGAIFLALEGIIGALVLGASFTMRQILASTIIYIMAFALVGLGIGILFSFLKIIFKSVEKNNPQKIILLLTSFAFFVLGFKPIFYEFGKRFLPNMPLLILIWAILIFALNALIWKLVNLKIQNRASLIRIRLISLTAFGTFLIILYFKIVNNPEARNRFAEIIPWWPILIIVSSIGVYLMAFAICKLLFEKIEGAIQNGFIKSMVIGDILIIISFFAGLIPLLIAHSSYHGSTKNALSKNRYPNIILLVDDALRADHLNLHGYDKVTCQNLNEFAARGVVFNKAYSLSSWTKPAMGSLNTSRYPEMNKVVGWEDKYSDDLRMLPEVLKDMRYHTAMISANSFLSPEYNFTQGMEDYNFVIGKGYKQLLFPGTLPKNMFPLLMEWAYEWDLYDSEIAYANAETMNSQIIPWLRQHRNGPFFLQIHYMDNHIPYKPSERNFSRGKKLTKEDLRIIKRVHDSYARQEYYPLLADKIISLYDDGIAFWDKQLANFFRAMTELDLWHNTLFIITADHGDEFLDHGTGGHGHSLYQELIHVPLVMSFPQGEFGGMKIDESVTLLDIMPTILDYIKAENKPPMEGTSLLTLLQKDSLSYRSHRKPYFGSVQPLEPEWRYWKMEAIIKGEYKYIRNYPHNSQQYRTELFNLALDEKEKQNLADSLFIIKDSLSKDMDGLIAYCDSAASTIAPMEKALKLSKTQREQLKALGYIK